MDDKKNFELKDEELKQVAGGACNGGTCRMCGRPLYARSELMVGVCYTCKNPELDTVEGRP